MITPITKVLESGQPYFIKSLSGECGDKVFKVQKNNDSQSYIVNDNLVLSIEEFFASQNLAESKFVVRSCLIQHDEINEIYPHSINTIRIVTIRNPFDGEIKPLAAILRVGAHGEVVDNWAKGGLAIKIDEKGHLSKFGFYKPGYGTRTQFHPDTKTKFEGIKIPYFEKCKNICCEFHSKLGIHSIGWDVAITKDGPVIIEGNDNWEISVMQVPCGPLKKEFDCTIKN